MSCPKCGSDNISYQREEVSSKTKSTEKIYIKKPHNIFWWFFLGWYYVPLKWFMKCLLNLCTLGLFGFLFRKKKIATTKGSATTKVKNHTVAVCQNCGHSWNA